MRALPSRLTNLHVARYFWVAAAGFLIDNTLFAAMHELGGVPTFSANMVSAAVGVTFVYFFSARRIFQYEGHFLLPKFAVYLGYQAVVIILFSALIAQIASSFGLSAPLVKVGIVPVQFVMNYLVLRGLLRMFEWA